MTVLAAWMCHPVGCTSNKSVPTLWNTVLPNEIWYKILEECDLTGYFHFLLAYPEMQSFRFSTAVEFDLLKKAIRELIHIEESYKFDYERYESIVAAIRQFIKFLPGQPLVEGETISGAGDEIRKITEKFWGDSYFSKCARQILFSALIENLHGINIDMGVFEEYRWDIMYAAALNGDYDQLTALMDKAKLGWNSHASYLVPAIAQSGSAQLFTKVVQGSSLQVFMHKSFWERVIKFDKRELFLEFVLQMAPGIDGNNIKVLESIYWICCHQERQELVRILVEHTFTSLRRIDSMGNLYHLISVGNMDILVMLLGDSASPGLWKSSSVNQYDLLTCARRLDRVDMFRFMLLLDSIDESVLLNVFSSAVSNGCIEIMELLLGARSDGRVWISTLVMVNDKIIGNIGYSGRVDVLEFFLRRRDEGDPRFDGFSVGMGDNEILCSACDWGRHELVKYLLRKNDETHEFMFPDVNPAARNNCPLSNAIKHIEVAEELLKRDETGGMIYPGVAVTTKVLINTNFKGLEYLLQTVENEDCSVRYKFPVIDINTDDHSLLKRLIQDKCVDKLRFLLRRNLLGKFVLPGVNVPECFLESLKSLGVSL